MTHKENSTIADDDGSDLVKPRIWQWVALGVFVAVIIAAFLYAKFSDGTPLLRSYETIADQIRDLGWWGQFAIIGLMIVHCFVPFPAEFVAFAAGSIFGVAYGTFLTWTGAMIGAILSFALTRVFGQPFVTMFLSKRQQKNLNQWTDSQGTATLLLSRFIPVIAFNLINYAAGLTRVSWWTFIWTTGIGILPLTTVMVYMGHGMRHLSWGWLFFVSAVCILLMAALHYFVKRPMDKKKLNR